MNNDLDQIRIITNFTIIIHFHYLSRFHFLFLVLLRLRFCLGEPGWQKHNTHRSARRAKSGRRWWWAIPLLKEDGSKGIESSSVLLKNASLPVLRLIGALRWSVKGGSVMAAEGGKYRRWRLHHGSGRWQVSLGYHVSNQRIRGKSEQRSLRAWEREQILKRKENSLRNGIETRVNSKIGDKTTTAYL